jgi:hypothetical protein
MNMEFSQTSGSKPELDRGPGIILKYDGETANGQAVSLVREFYRWRPPETVACHMGPSRARSQLILQDLRHDRYGETGFHWRRSSAKKQLAPARTRLAAGNQPRQAIV